MPGASWFPSCWHAHTCLCVVAYDMSDYGLLSRFLHRLALGVPAIAEASFDAEQAILGKEPVAAAGGHHVFVAGLARSGTTVLMRSLFETGEFCSLTYRDMPFILAPGLWSRITRNSRVDRDATQRAHGDGVMVDFDSPEALEEVFWRIFCGSSYIRRDRLVGMHADAEAVKRFQSYVALILARYRGSRYLSKNNNNILRLGSLIEAFPSSRIVVPFREPLQQAYSLLTQHRRFREKHVADKFTASYMSWLAHYEFGADHRPFEWGMAVSKVYSPDTLDYWLAQWVGVYGHLLQAVQGRREHVRFFGYESLCSQTRREWQRLGEFVGLNAPAPTQLKASRSAMVEPVDARLRVQAEAMHCALLSAAEV
jgi:hypothetical protein